MSQGRVGCRQARDVRAQHDAGISCPGRVADLKSQMDEGALVRPLAEPIFFFKKRFVVRDGNELLGGITD